MRDFDIWEATELIDHITNYMTNDLYKVVPGEVRSWEFLANANNMMRDMASTINKLLQFVSISKKAKGAEPMDRVSYRMCLIALGDKNNHLRETVLNIYLSFLEELIKEHLDYEEHHKSIGFDYSDSVDDLNKEFHNVEIEIEKLYHR